MINELSNLNSQEHIKDLMREADNERLARRAAKTNNSILNSIRNVLGQNSAKTEQQSSEEKQR